MGVILRSMLCIGVITAISPMHETGVETKPSQGSVQAQVEQVVPQAIMAGHAVAGHAMTVCAKNTDMCRAALSHLSATAEPATGKIPSKRTGS